MSQTPPQQFRVYGLGFRVSSGLDFPLGLWSSFKGVGLLLRVSSRVED